MYLLRFVKVNLVAFFLTLSLTAAFANTDITLISPKTGSNSGSPVFYEATATSTCASGIAAMRIYTAPHASAYTVNGAHIETFVNLKPGTYNTVVQAWDNCGGVAKVPVTVTVNSTAQVSVFLPADFNSASPAHFAASAQNPVCPAGIAAMRIYTSWGVTPYTVDSNKLNAYVVLKAASYDATVQAWDNCGNVLKTNFQVRSSGADEDSYVYADSQYGVISQFNVLAGGKLANPNGSGNPPQFPSAPGSTNMALDPGGWFVYAGAKDGIYAYQINHPNGALVPVQGSPYPLSGYGNVFADPAGNFLYVVNFGTITSYRIDRSSGALTMTASLTPGPIFSTLSPDPYGQFLYVGTTNTGEIYGYKVNPDTGALTTAPGSPYTVPNAADIFALTSAYQYLYAGVTTTGAPEIDAYEISYNSGYLSAVPGSPYSAPDSGLDSQSVLADWLARYLWTANETAGSDSFSFWEFDINGYTGSLGPGNYIPVRSSPVFELAEGHAANIVYSAGTTCGGGTCAAKVDSWGIDGSGLLVHLSGPLSTGTQIPTGIVVERENPQ
jgi:6-phosphogluconolactonase (cycloisomerase 2 family)